MHIKYYDMPSGMNPLGDLINPLLYPLPDDFFDVLNGDTCLPEEAFGQMDNSSKASYPLLEQDACPVEESTAKVFKTSSEHDPGLPQASKQLNDNANTGRPFRAPTRGVVKRMR